MEGDLRYLNPVFNTARPDSADQKTLLRGHWRTATYSLTDVKCKKLIPFLLELSLCSAKLDMESRDYVAQPLYLGI